MDRLGSKLVEVRVLRGQQLRTTRARLPDQAGVAQQKRRTHRLIRRLLCARRSRPGSERRELLAAEGRAREPPTAFGCLSKYHPGATGLCRVAGDLGHNLGDLFDELLLAFADNAAGGVMTWTRTL